MLHSLADFAQVCRVSKPAITQAVKRGLITRGTDGKIDDTDPVNALYLGGKTGAVKKASPGGGAGRKAKTVPDTLPGELGGDRLRRLDSIARARATPPDSELTAAVLKAQAKREKKRPDGSEGEDAPDPEETEEDFDKLLEAIKADGGQAGLLLKKLIADIRYKERASERYELEIETKKKNLVERAQLVTVVQGINKAIDDHFHRLPAKTGPVLYALAKREGSSELEVIRALEVSMGEAMRKATEDVCRLA